MKDLKQSRTVLFVKRKNPNKTPRISLSCFANLLYKMQHFSKIQDYFGKVIFGHLFLSNFEK